MSAKNPRINITLEEKMIGLLSQLAKREQKSLAGLARELILESLERREDIALSSIAKIRDTKNAKRIKHDDVWK